MNQPFIAGTDNSQAFLHIGSGLLRKGSSAVDAVEATIRAVEANPEDHSVGLGGVPNLRGVIRLDASIMDGRTFAASTYNEPVYYAMDAGQEQAKERRGSKALRRSPQEIEPS